MSSSHHMDAMEGPEIPKVVSEVNTLDRSLRL